MSSQLGQSLVKFQVFDALGARTGSVIILPLPVISLFSQGYATWPSFSPDGTKVVFQHYSSVSPSAVLTIRDGSGNPLVENVSTNPRNLLHGILLGLCGGSFVESGWKQDRLSRSFRCQPHFHREWNEPENGSTNPRVEVANESGMDLRILPSPSRQRWRFRFNYRRPIPPNLISWWPGENAAWGRRRHRRGIDEELRGLRSLRCRPRSGRASGSMASTTMSRGAPT